MTSCLKGTTGGFTLLELLISVAVIGILASIALPQFAFYRQKAYNATAQSDVRNARLFIESYFAEARNYPH